MNHAGRLAVIMTVYNRMETTRVCLDRLLEEIETGITLDIFIHDGGSTDGTIEMILNDYPEVNLTRGIEDYWNEGMLLAWRSALPGEYNFYLWLNDDVVLSENSISRLLRLYERKPENSIIVGRTVSEDRTKSTYGGLIRSGRISNLKFRMLTPEEEECDTMHGNCVLIPKIAISRVGLNSGDFRHSTGDIEYGLRARKAGFFIYEEKQPVGRLDRNDEWEQSTKKITSDNYKYIFFNPKGIPINEWFTFTRKYGGILWPINFMARYLKMIRINS